MNKKALKTLEYDKIIDKLTALADTSQGKELCAKLLPQTDIILIKQAQEETSDGLTRLFRKGSISLLVFMI